MPEVQIDLLKGRSKEQMKKIVAGITDTLVKEGGAKPEAVHVVIREFDADHYALGGKLKSEL